MAFAVTCANQAKWSPFPRVFNTVVEEKRYLPAVFTSIPCRGALRCVVRCGVSAGSVVCQSQCDAEFQELCPQSLSVVLVGLPPPVALLCDLCSVDLQCRTSRPRIGLGRRCPARCWEPASAVPELSVRLYVLVVV